MVNVARMLILLILFFPPLIAQATELPQEARDRIDYLLGTWDIYEDELDENGNIVETTHLVNITEYFLGNSVLVTTIIPDDGPVRKTIRFYDKGTETFYEISVGTEGDLYILSGGLDKYVMSFKSRQMRNGVYPLGRFTHTNIETNSFEAKLDISYDDGESWERVNRNQRLIRRTSD